MSQQGANKWHISPVEFSSYYTYYHRVTPPGTLLAGSRAREFFLQTKLPPQTLSQIWKLADIDGDGQLNDAEFGVAMHLTRVALKDNAPLPTSCPSPLQSLVRQTLYPQLPVANQAHLEKCKKAFGAFFENIGKGVLGGDAARYLMLKSNLPKPQLYHIWRLSDMDCDGRLSFLEFTVAMHLIFIAKLGYTLPVNLDPNTILPPSFYRLMEEVRRSTQQQPLISPKTPEPFSPPQTPSQDTPPTFFGGENPFVTDAFVNLSARKFRDGQFDDSVGDPFETGDPFSSDGDADHDISVQSGDFVSSSSLPEVVQNGHESVALEAAGDVPNGVARLSPTQVAVSPQSMDRPSPEMEREQLSQSDSRASSRQSIRDSRPTSSSLHKEDSVSSPVLSSRESLNNVSPPLGTSQESLGKLSPQQRTSQESLGKLSPRQRTSQESLGKLSPLQRTSQESLGKLSPRQRTSQESLGKLSLGERGSAGSISDRSSSPNLSTGLQLSQESGASSSPKTKSRRRSERSSTASFHEVVIVERVEPVLQQATAVDVISSREATPVPVPGTVESGPERVSVELESLSRASRQFLEESQSKLEEQQRRNLSCLVPVECREVSVRSLPAAIRDMEVEASSSSHSQVSSSKAQEDVDLNSDDLDTADVMSQLDDLEAEMLSQLDDADFDLDDFDDEEESVPINEDQIEVGALDLDGPDLDREAYRDEDRKTPVSDAAAVTSNHDDGAPVHMNGVTEEPIVVKRGSNVASLYQAKEEEKKRKSLYLEAAMDELDDFLGDELGEINDMFQEFQTKDKVSEERRQKEEQDLKNMEAKLKSEHEQQKMTVVVPDGDTAESVERIARRRQTESQKIAEEWEKEMVKLEEDAMKDLQKHNVMKEVESDALVVTLDAELQSLVKQEEEAVKIAQKEKELLAAREKAEQEQRERERKERLMKKGDREEMTIEEWIEWMEEKKKAGMTPEQLEELERRKAIWSERQKQREEKRKREEEEQLAKTRKKMEVELRAIRERDQEIKSTRLTDEELEARRRQKALRDQQESDERKEKSKQAKEMMRRQELEEMKPKAKSALAARWEERIRARSEGKITREENRNTVLTGNGMHSVKREEERLSRRISRPLSTSSSNGSEEGETNKRQSVT